MPGLTDVAADLYGRPLPEFTSARTAAARRARGDGDRDLARAVTALSKPTAGAGGVNLLVRERPDVVADLLALGARLRDAQARGAGDDVRALAREQHRLLADAVGQAADLIQAGGAKAGATTLQQVEATLRAAMADPDAARAVVTGVLTRDLVSTGLEPVDVTGAVAVPDAPGLLDVPAGGPARLRVLPGGAGAEGEEDAGAGDDDGTDAAGDAVVGEAEAGADDDDGDGEDDGDGDGDEGGDDDGDDGDADDDDGDADDGGAEEEDDAGTAGDPGDPTDGADAGGIAAPAPAVREHRGRTVSPRRGAVTARQAGRRRGRLIIEDEPDDEAPDTGGQAPAGHAAPDAPPAEDRRPAADTASADRRHRAEDPAPSGGRRDRSERERRRRELAEARDDDAAAVAARDAAEDRLAELRSRERELSAAVQATLDELAELRDRLAGLEDEAADAEAATRRARDERDAAERAADDARARLRDARRRLDAL